MVDQGLQKLFDDDDTGNGIAGDTQNGLFSLTAKNRRLAGLHGDAVVQHLTHLPDNTGGEIFPARRRTGVQNHQIAFRSGFFHHSFDSVIFVGNDGVNLGFRAPLPHHGRENRTVEFQYITGLGIGAGRNDFVTGGDDTHHGLADHFYLQHTACDHGTDGGRRNLHMGREDHFTGADVFADLADVLPGCSGGMDGDGTILILDDILHHDDCITVFGNRITGVQNNKLAGI